MEEFKSAKRKNEISADKLDGDGALILAELKENWDEKKGKKKKKH
ncbi:hypothetical protein Q4Q39_00425 [Flavivirga amylovorans]|uniref:Uncharacterized protein n=1 Tax=Flavivirga amylovorans TaxID=870486 RepID=A0ABT8WWX6_9FLAO|nr:hypothetical protein [Flavivirga amylovorans]MDO5985855.1 hypothetical protein [Flavivirga amylovorans]